MLAAGCGVTPIMSMRRWLAKYRPEADVQVIFNVRSPEDVIFAEEWRQYAVTLVAGKQRHPRLCCRPPDRRSAEKRTGSGLAYRDDLRACALYGNG
ncbi:NADH oxidoreductase hcr [Raoultella terrigena]|uniref:NADH oxidoreductase hcr n=1 Tax=Raoultella terrigena TaxID=577 RepID=A0A3P8M257_RAOTE|nr:NADH oxidoreductase hcr [Raoultella terrigena]